MTTGEGGMVTTHERGDVAPARQHAQPGSRRRRRLARPRAARLQLPHRRHQRRARDRAAREARQDPVHARTAAAARYGELLAGIDGLEIPLADDADHVRSWFVYVVTLARGTDRERVIAELEREGIATSRYLPSMIPGLHARTLRLLQGLCPVSEDLRSAPSRSRSSPRSKRRTRNESPRRSRPRWRSSSSRQGDSLAVWGLYALEAAATLVTYSRLSPDLLYNVDSAGDLAGGLSRTLTVVNYPLALGAIALARSPAAHARSSGRRSRSVRWSRSREWSTRVDLDARWINALPASESRSPSR